MFSDAALALAVDTTTKWLYNAARRLDRPLLRSFADVSWWRLTHHLAGHLGIPLSDAARASDLLLRQGSDLSRVRLGATTDDSVAISVDLPRFHDGAALAAAAALYLAAPRRRGRPPRVRGTEARSRASRAEPAADNAALRLWRAAAAVPPSVGDGALSPAIEILAALSAAEIPFVIGGGIAAVFHGEAAAAGSIELIADLSIRHSRTLAAVLNSLRAVPRGVSIREAFLLDSGLIRSAPCLALRVNDVAVNITGALPGVGEYPQASEASVSVPFDQRSLRVLSMDALLRTPAGLARAGSPA